MAITDLKRNLKTLSRAELENLIVDLYKKKAEAKELIDVYFKPEREQAIFDKYKEKIINEFFPNKGFGKLRYSVMSKALKNFKDISNNHHLIAELMMTHVENGVNFTNTYGDIDDKFYNNIAGMYAKTLEYVTKHNLEEKYKNRFQKIVTDTEEIGWGFHDELAELYYHYYAE